MDSRNISASCGTRQFKSLKILGISAKGWDNLTLINKSFLIDIFYALGCFDWLTLLASFDTKDFMKKVLSATCVH